MTQRIRQPRPLASEPQRTIDSPYLTTAEAAAYLRFSDARCLYKAIYGGLDVPFVRRGKTMLFHRGDLDRWLNGESRVAMLNDARSKVGA
jgi:excisionase family DNA binding protein